MTFFFTIKKKKTAISYLLDNTVVVLLKMITRKCLRVQNTHVCVTVILYHSFPVILMDVTRYFFQTLNRIHFPPPPQNDFWHKIHITFHTPTKKFELRSYLILFHKTFKMKLIRYVSINETSKGGKYP